MNLEEKRISAEDKTKIIQSLTDKDHDYMSFFVCRNPIEKLLSIFDMKKEQHRLRLGKGKRLEEFLAWPELLSLWSQDWRSL